ncbi:hypothetical protein K470DRAFT_93413 [Piedraia hortae CBS 480.64]|uniref:Uncharacterized protein n=1 Tax=Piedraia hortae CBS 480.64 TaxID=1314780 RepID=A0A6A7BX35_9PEZI|nr:hypothetical protein K470DRAFT_93413 [Piedraia hortae CBS 480.64]
MFIQRAQTLQLLVPLVPPLRQCTSYKHWERILRRHHKTATKILWLKPSKESRRRRSNASDVWHCSRCAPPPTLSMTGPWCVPSSKNFFACLNVSLFCGEGPATGGGNRTPSPLRGGAPRLDKVTWSANDGNFTSTDRTSPRAAPPLLPLFHHQIVPSKPCNRPRRSCAAAGIPHCPFWDARGRHHNRAGLLPHPLSSN